MSSCFPEKLSPSYLCFSFIVSLFLSKNSFTLPKLSLFSLAFLFPILPNPCFSPDCVICPFLLAVLTVFTLLSLISIFLSQLSLCNYFSPSLPYYPSPLLFLILPLLSHTLLTFHLISLHSLSSPFLPLKHVSFCPLLATCILTFAPKTEVSFKCYVLNSIYNKVFFM